MLQRGQEPLAENQRENVRIAAEALSPLARDHELVITHGNGPQVGLLALQDLAYREQANYPLDVLGAETEGMIGYQIEQEMGNVLPADRRLATLLTQTEVDPQDLALQNPSKPIGPVYDATEAGRLTAARGWRIAPDGDKFRRVVPSPRPRRILELGVIDLLLENGVIVICAGGGGIPVIRRDDDHKDAASALLARELGAQALLMLTDVDAVYRNWRQSAAAAIRRIAVGEIRRLEFAPGSMAPKVDAACEFAELSGGFAGIGRLQDAQAILAGETGTIITADPA